MGAILDNHSKCNNKTAESNYMYYNKIPHKYFCRLNAIISRHEFPDSDCGCLYIVMYAFKTTF